MWGGGCAAHVVVKFKMVENNEEFCLPHNLSYEGSYHVRHFYPRLICCRHSSSPQEPGMTSPPGADGQSPASSPQRRPLLAHVEGSAVVSKIAVPPGHPPLTCSSTAGIGLRGMGLGPGGSGGAGEGGAGGRGAGGGRGVVVQQPTPTSARGSMFTTPRPHGTTTTYSTTSTGNTAIQNGESADGNQNVTISSGSLTPSSLEKYLITVSTHGGDNYHLLMGDGHQGGSEEQKHTGGSTEDYGGEAGASAASPVSPDSVVDSHTRAVFRLSDGSDFSDDYIAMTDVNCSGTDEQLQNGVVNGSSVCSDVFSDTDRSSEQDDLTSPALSDVTGQDATSHKADDDDATPKVFPGQSQDADRPTHRKILLVGQGHDDLGDDTDPLQAPSVTSPDITLEEVFDLQRVNVNDDGGFYDDKEFDFLKAVPVKRSTSLKTYKTPPGTPKRKMVRFADALGLDLESVRHILNMEAPPRVPQSAMKDLKLEEPGGQLNKGPLLTQGARYLTACFPQPGINPTFPLMVRDRKVILESCVIYDHNLSVSGMIRVANIHFHKDVTVRCTTNNWLTFNDINAGYVHNSNDGPTDRFSFTISLPHYFSTGSRLQFCIRYVTGGQDFWDNNHGANYVIECYARTMPDLDNTWTSFL